MKEKEILQALQKGVTAAVAASTSATLPVKYLGRTFKPPVDGKWLEIIFIPNNADDECWDDTKTYRGILRLLLHWPMSDEGFYDPLDLISSITNGLRKGTILHDTDNTVQVKITENPNLTGAIEEAPQAMFPCSIRYQCFVQSS